MANKGKQPQKVRKVPMRRCVGCYEMKPKNTLIRVVKPPEGACFVDRTGKASGRGAYLCDNVECLKKAQKAKALERALETQIDEAVFAQLAERIVSEGQA